VIGNLVPEDLRALSDLLQTAPADDTLL